MAALPWNFLSFLGPAVPRSQTFCHPAPTHRNMVGHVCTHSSPGKEQQTWHCYLEQNKENMPHHWHLRTARPKCTQTREDENWHIYTTVCQPSAVVPRLLVRSYTHRFGSHGISNELIDKLCRAHHGARQWQTHHLVFWNLKKRHKTRNCAYISLSLMRSK